MSLEKCRELMPIARLWGALGLPGAEKVMAVEPGREVKICSPFREDRNPSFSVWVNSDGVGFWKDHGTEEAGDEVQLLEKARGLSNVDAMKAYHDLAGVAWGKGGTGARKAAKAPGRRPVVAQRPDVPRMVPGVPGPADVQAAADVPRERGPLGDPVAVYTYRDAAGAVAHETLRYEPKTFRQRRPGGLGEAEWVWTLKDAPVFPYMLPELLAAPMEEPVFLVEGEKDVENLRRLGERVVATTLPMGAGKWRPEFGEYFAGRWVILVPDDDKPGEEGAAKVAGELFGVVDRLGIMRVRDVWRTAPGGSDISDWLENGWENDARVEDQAAELMVAAERAGVEDLELWDGVTHEGAAGRVSVYEDRVARRIVKASGLIYCGDSFWQWKRAEGVWEKKREKTWLDRQVRRGLVKAGAEELVTANRVASIVSLARSERVRFPEQLNRYPEGCLPVRNGLLDVDAGRLLPHRHGHLTTVQTPHVWEPGAKAPEWEKWLAERQPDEATRAQLQEIFGYCLFTHINYHSFFFLYGEGGTGKSTCVDVLEWLVGSENKVALELTELDNPFLRSQLVGKSLYLAKELTSKSFRHVGLIKAMVSGDPISVDVKYGQGFDFRPKGRLVMESNVLAATPDSSGGFERRFIQVNFDEVVAKGQREYGFQNRFKAEMSGILNWAIEGYLRLRERGRFEHTKRSQGATDDLLKHRAQIPSFIKAGWLVEDAAALAGKTGVRMGRVHEMYMEWCECNDVVAFFDRRETFGREFFTRKPEWRTRKKRVRLDGGARDFELKGVLADPPANLDMNEEVGI